MARCKTLQTDRELYIARSNDVLDLEVRELGVEAKLLNDTSILAGSELGIILGLRASNNHLAGSEDQGRSLWLTDTHDNGSETLLSLVRRKGIAMWVSKYLGVVFGISRVQSNRLQVQAAIQVDRGDDVSLRTR